MFINWDDLAKIVQSYAKDEGNVFIILKINNF